MPLDSLTPGHRVRHEITKVRALVINRPEYLRGNQQLVLVALEGSTRSEHWPVHRVELRPRVDQFVALGGLFVAPPGYPLIPVNS